MKNKTNTIIIDNKDNVAMTLSEVKQGEKLSYYINDEYFEISAYSDIPIYHKFALADINKGDKLIKYGEFIGYALKDIHLGEHVHVHNIASSIKEEK